MNAPTGRALVNAQAAIESFSLSPDGGTLVYALRRVERGEYVSHLWSVPWSGGRARRLTGGRVRDATPVIAPDGRRVAFARAPVGAKRTEGQVWIAALDGTSEPWQLTRQKHGASAPRWSPEGRRIAFLGQAGPHRFLVGREDPKRAPIARRITRTDFRDDESGHLLRRTHLWLVEARRRARPRRLTDGDFDVAEPTWAPDGRWLAFTTDIGADSNLMPRKQIYRVALDGGPHAPLASLAGDAALPAISPDGSQLAFLGTDVADPGDAVLTELWVVSLAAGGRPRCLTAALDRSVGSVASSDLVVADDALAPLWLEDGGLLVLVGDRARKVPYRIGLDGGTTPLLEPDRLVGASLATAGEQIVMSAGVDGQASELYAVEGWRSPPGLLRRLTSQGSAWQSRFPLPSWEEHWVEGPGGPIQAWVISPADAPSGPMPTVFIFHGGPTGSAAPGGTMDSTMLTGHGYRVVLPNVRGSATFGADWIAALGGRWGEADAADGETVAATMVERGLVDPRRMGVMGLSYGGFLSQWLAGHSSTFAAAVAENGVANQISAWANSHFGVHYNRRAGLPDPLTDEGAMGLWRRSPLQAASDIRIPLLMLQAEEDRTCPAADNEQLFTALKVLGREVEYILYPEEHHRMKNDGRPDRRIDRMERILAWFDRYLRR
jgi:dipeptidyl aminopeptidase/acylaminoacyl peptidase